MINDPVIILVDENDAIIGAKKRSLVSMAIGDIYRITALWVTNSEGAILLAQRSFSKRNLLKGGRHQYPGRSRKVNRMMKIS
jgi:isopentenyldiphosphate isomerase